MIAAAVSCSSASGRHVFNNITDQCFIISESKVCCVITVLRGHTVQEGGLIRENTSVDPLYELICM